MKVTIINGSQRHARNSQSLKVSHYIEQRLIEKNICELAHVISMFDKPYPLWDEGVWDGEDRWKEALAPISLHLEQSDAFILVAPEYHGMAPPALKNFLLFHSKYQIGHKPALLVGVSSSDGGAYPLAELRMNSSKNNRLCYIPEQLIIRHVESVLNEDVSKNNQEADQYFRDRIDFALGILKEYAKALRQVRESGVVNHDAFGFGM